MSRPVRRVVIVAGGLGVPSSTALLASRLGEATRNACAEVGVECVTEEVSLRPLARDIASALVTGFPPPALEEALDRVRASDAIIAVSPVFAASFSGLFKSFVDLWDPDGFTGRPVLVAATGGTSRHSLVLDHALRPLFAYLRAAVVPTGVFAATADWGTGAEDADPALPRRIGRAAAELATALAGRGASAVSGSAEEEEEGIRAFAAQLRSPHAHPAG
ncbi:CE1759 family FMN reductase [Streptomyces sp. NPDC097595]|uniref:CE1759 family FMN reductase n=1 Tax=Streptomyces sp. NPDC097595 TaxID=3366090 RepID=UPI0037F321F7